MKDENSAGAVGDRRERPFSDELNREVGLCERCTHAQIVKSARGSVFYLCMLSRVDPAFPKYPRLPVLACRGYRPGGGVLAV